MNENLYERKQKFRNYLNQEYAPKPRKWWHTQGDDFRTTRSVAAESQIRQFTNEEVILKSHNKKAVIVIAFFILMMIACNTYGNGMAEKMAAGACAVLVLAIPAYFLAKIGDNKPAMIINESGIWLDSITFSVSWEHIVSTYIEYVISGDDTSHNLLIYYYNENADDFQELKYRVSGLGMKMHDLAFHIEGWKIRSGYPSPGY